MPERATLVLDWLLIVIDGIRGEWQVLPLPSLTLSCTGEVEVGKYQDSRCTSRFFHRGLRSAFSRCLLTPPSSFFRLVFRVVPGL